MFAMCRRHVAGGDAKGETLDDRRLADPASPSDRVCSAAAADRMSTTCRISASRPRMGSILPARARAVRSMVYWSSDGVLDISARRRRRARWSAKAPVGKPARQGSVALTVLRRAAEQLAGVPPKLGPRDPGKRRGGLEKQAPQHLVLDQRHQPARQSGLPASGGARTTSTRPREAAGGAAARTPACASCRGRSAPAASRPHARRRRRRRRIAAKRGAGPCSWPPGSRSFASRCSISTL